MKSIKYKGLVYTAAGPTPKEDLNKLHTLMGKAKEAAQELLYEVEALERKGANDLDGSTLSKAVGDLLSWCAGSKRVGASDSMQTFHLIRINRDSKDIFAATTYAEAMDLASPDKTDTVESSIIRARDAGEARLLAAKLPNSHWNRCTNPNAGT